MTALVVRTSRYTEGIDPFYPLRYSPTHMSQDFLIKLRAPDTGEVRYTRKNKKKVQRKIELLKFSNVLKKRIIFKEAKK